MPQKTNSSGFECVPVTSTVNTLDPRGASDRLSISDCRPPAWIAPFRTIGSRRAHPFLSKRGLSSWKRIPQSRSCDRMYSEPPTETAGTVLSAPEDIEYR